MYSPAGGRCGKAGNDFNSGCRTTGGGSILAVTGVVVQLRNSAGGGLENAKLQNLKTIGAGSESLATAKLQGGVLKGLKT